MNMRPFKFFREIEEENPYIGLRWVDIEIDGYMFRIQTHHSSYQIRSRLNCVNRGYMRMWDDHMNRDRLLELLRERFDNAVNVIGHDELVRNGGYI
jgi:hypothetical protein